MVASREESRPPTLVRVIGVPGLAFAMVNGILGASIFGLPAAAAAIAGPAAVLGYLVCIAVYGLAGLCFAEIGSRVPESGGLYAYIAVAWGPLAGAVAGTLSWLIMGAVASAAITVLLADQLAPFFPALTSGPGRLTFLVAIYGGFACINIVGARAGSRASAILAIVKLVPLVLLVIVGLFSMRPANFTWHTTATIPTILRTSVLLAFAFGGIETGLAAGGEVVRPAYTVPRAILLSLAPIAVLYVGLQTVAQGVLGPGLPTEHAALAATARVALGPWGAWLLSVALFVSVMGYVAADILCFPRCMYALATDGLLPRPLARIYSRSHAPVVAILVYASVCLALAAFGSFTYLAIMASSTTLLLYAGCMLGLLRLRARGVALAATPFVARGGSAPPIVVTIAIAAMLASLELREILVTLPVIIAAAAAYSIILRRRGQRGARTAAT